MKVKFQYIVLLAFCAIVISCEKDNYDAPSSKLSGRLVYQGQPIGGLERDQVPFELYQFGFGKVGPIGASFTQEATFSAVLFDGNYKLIIPNGQGPFVWKKTGAGAPDTIPITLAGSQQLDLEVTPYYLIKGPQITGAGGKVSATFGLQKVITGTGAQDIENANLYINKTQFVSESSVDRVAKTTIAGTAITDVSNISLQVTVPTLQPTQNYVFARVGIKIKNVEDRLYSPVVKVTF
ncbi:MAG TPA: DUF3823 domain-containing protein [Flavitalea sp.]|nr:DUF3823 domain-containing protein [Flavitalea sp.]